MIIHHILAAALFACAFSGCVKKGEAKSTWVCPVCKCPEGSGCGCSPEEGCKCPPGQGCQCTPDGKCRD